MTALRVLLRVRALALAPCLFGACGPTDGAVAGAATQTPADRNAQKRMSALKFDELGKDLGKVVHPGGAETHFTFRNTGTKAVGIMDILASCGCTNPRLRIVKDGKFVREGHGRGEARGPLLVVEPGETGELHVRFDTLTLQGNVKDHMSRITLATDERVDPLDVFIKAEIERLFDVVPGVFAFEPMGAKQMQQKEVKILVFSHEAESPLEPRVVSMPPGVKVEALETTDGIRPVIWVGATAGPGLAKGGVQGDVVVEFKFGKGDKKEVKTVKIPAFIPVMADVFMTPTTFDFQIVEVDKPAKSAPVTLELLDPDKVYKLGTPRIEGEVAGRLKLDIETLVEGHKYKMTLVADKGLPAATQTGHHGLVRVETGLTDFPELRLPFRAYTRTVPVKDQK